MNLVVTDPPGRVSALMAGYPAHDWIGAYEGLRDRIAQDFAEEKGLAPITEYETTLDQLRTHAMTGSELKRFLDASPKPVPAPQSPTRARKPELSPAWSQTEPDDNTTLDKSRSNSDHSAPSVDKVESKVSLASAVGDRANIQESERERNPRNSSSVRVGKVQRIRKLGNHITVLDAKRKRKVKIGSTPEDAISLSSDNEGS